MNTRPWTLGLLLAAVGSFPQPSHASQVEAIDSIVRVAERAGLHGTLLIRRHRETLLHEAYGWADKEAGRPMTVETGFDIGSLVKPVTAVAVYRLEELGLLSTSDTLGRFFPSAPADKAAITLQQLLTHTSGMRDMFGGDYQVVSRDWVLEKAMGAPLLGPPGGEERYSNSGYSLLAMIIEDVTGRPYEAWVRDQILERAGVPNIGYTLAGWEPDRLAVGYGAGGARWGTPLDKPWAADGPSWNLRGNGGMLASAEDMSRWYEALFDGKILEAAALENYYRFHVGESRSVGVRALGHAGGNGVFNTLQVSFIDRDVHMTFFTSTADQQAETVWTDIRQHVMALARDASERD